MHDYELVARGVVTCYAYPVAETCEGTLPYEVPVRDAEETRIESAIDRVAIAAGWSMYSHPGGMRYRPQWYCPRHVQKILNIPDDADDSFAADLKNHLWPDRKHDHAQPDA